MFITGLSGKWALTKNRLALMPTYFYFPPRIIRQKHMADENTPSPATGSQPTQTSQNPPATQGEGGQQGSANQGQRRNDRRDRSRHHGPRRDTHRRDQPQQAQRPPQIKATGGKEETADIDAAEEEGEERPSQQNRQHHRRGGRPPKRVIEEWVNDPYCE